MVTKRKLFFTVRCEILQWDYMFSLKTFNNEKLNSPIDIHWFDV